MRPVRSDEIALLRQVAGHLDGVMTDTRRQLEQVRARLRELTAPTKPEIGAHDE